MRLFALGVACLGLLLTPMVTRADPVAECQEITSNQVEARQCLRDTLNTAEAVMALALHDAQMKVDNIDQVTGRPDARQALDRSQAEWLQFRDINCLVPGAIAAGGSGSGAFIVGCQIDMTRARTDDLQRFGAGPTGRAPSAPPDPPSEATPALTQGEWLWTGTDYGDSTQLQSQDPNAYTVAFTDDGQVAIRADCNRGTGTYATDGSQLTITPGAMTLAACPPGSQDTVFLRDLFRVATYVFDGPRLVLNLQLDSGNMIFSPQPATTLVGPTWRVTNYNNGKQGVVSTLAGTDVSLTFSDDGRVSGNTGCNLLQGPYTESGSSISIGPPLATTRRACASNDANQQEQQFLAALSAVTTYEVAGNRLTLRDDNGATQIVAIQATVEP